MSYIIFLIPSIMISLLVSGSVSTAIFLIDTSYNWLASFILISFALFLILNLIYGSIRLITKKEWTDFTRNYNE